MKIPEWTKKQTVLIGVLTGILLCAALFLIAVLTRPAAATLLDDPDLSDRAESIEVIEEGAVALSTEATPPPDLSLRFVADREHPLPEDGAELPLGGTYTIGGTIYSN
ncbi:MAG: hypothetical protein II412_01140, partial [Clostridia bacterium]|nr:hypothetical protein [Clostridia bacterium]